jgi:hypothetical protein
MEQPSPARIALKWGLLTALIEILMTSIRYAMGYYFSFTFPFLTLLVLLLGLTMAMRELRTQNGGFMGYSEGLSLGVLMFAVIGLLDTTYTMVYQSFIDPGMTAKYLTQYREFLEGFNLPDESMEQITEQLDQAADQQKKKGISGVSYILSIFGWIFSGFLLSLIVSGFMSRKKSNPFD